MMMLMFMGMTMMAFTCCSPLLPVKRSIRGSAGLHHLVIWCAATLPPSMPLHSFRVLSSQEFNSDFKKRKRKALDKCIYSYICLENSHNNIITSFLNTECFCSHPPSPPRGSRWGYEDIVASSRYLRVKERLLSSCRVWRRFSMWKLISHAFHAWSLNPLMFSNAGIALQYVNVLRLTYESFN